MSIPKGSVSHDFRVPPPVQMQLDVLADQANEGLLTEEERALYEAFINAADFVSVLKLKAGQQLKSNGG